LVLDGNGQAWIQEANDYGFPMMPFQEYGNYPGCSSGQWKSYAPEFPGTAPEFAMGGTGLSGLALSDTEKTAGGKGRSRAAQRVWPAPYDGQFYIANPITRKIQGVQVTSEGPRFRYQKLPDFLLSSDEWFRPVALRTGPDGCLYLVDWYNKIISHNEVPRNHPERDKKRGRIWRVRHKDIEPWAVPDFTKLSGEELLARLGGVALQQSHMAWQAITDRQMTNLAPKLKKLAGDKSAGTSRRLAALWALEGLHSADASTVKEMLKDADRNVRREAARAYADNPLANVADFEPLVRDADPEVRAQAARSLGRLLMATTGQGGNSASATRAVAALLQMGNASLPGPTMKSTHTGRMIKAGPAYEREFERYLVRFNLERNPEVVADFLRSDGAAPFPAENRLLAALALEPKAGATEVARLLPQLERAPGDEELLRLAQYPEQPGVGDAFKAVLRKPETRNGAIESLLRVRTKLDATKLGPLLTESARELLAEGATIELGIRLAGAFQISAVEPDLTKVLERGWRWTPERGPNQTAVLEPAALSALRALGELKSERVDTFTRLAARGQSEVQGAAIVALAASRNPMGPQRLATLYPTLPQAGRKAAVGGLCSTKVGAHALVKAIRAGTVAKDDLDGATFDKLQAVLGDDTDLAGLMQEMAAFFRPALRLNGEDNAWTETDVTLSGAFTVETWIRLDPGVDNNDGILGVPGALDMNFFDGRFRVWVGGQVHDAIVARKKTVPEVWTHLAVSRDAAGRFRIYQNGELDTDESKLATQAFEKVRIGWTAPGKGTAAWLSEFRIWSRERSAGEIRADFDRSFAGEEVPGLERVYTAGNWGQLHGGARIQKTQDFPALLTAAEAKAVAERFAFFRGLAEKEGDSRRGGGLFTTTCLTCHTVAGRGGQIGPVLSGAGALGVEALLRNILTPNAAMEPGYRVFRVEMQNGEIVDGLLVSQDKEAIILRRQRAEDLRIPQTEVKRASFTKLSMMPEGLLDAFQPKDVTDLFAYLKTLK
jgi:putative heme-binding domain-containing protein